MGGRHQNVRGDDGLAHFLDAVLRRQLRGVIHKRHGAVGVHHFVDHCGRGSDEIEVVFALEALLHNFHVQQAEEANAEAETQRRGHFRFVDQSGVIQLQLLQSVAELFVVFGADREKAGEHARLYLLEPSERRGARVGIERDGVPHRGAIDFLDASDDEADFARREAVAVEALRREPPDAAAFMRTARGPHAQLLAGLQGAVHDAHQRHHTHVVVEPRVDDEGLQRCLRVALGRRNALHQFFEEQVDVLAGLGADTDRLAGVDADDFFDFLHDPFRVCRGQVDLVDDRQHLKALVERGVAVGDGLRLHPLRRVHH